MDTKAFASITYCSWASLPEELARYFNGATLAIRKSELIGVEAIVSLNSGTIKKVLKQLVGLVCLRFSIFLIVKGIEMPDVVKG